MYEQQADDEGTAELSTAFTDGDLSMFAMDEEEGEISELASRRRPDEAEIKFTKAGLIHFIDEKLSDENKDNQVWKPRLTRDTIRFAAKDPEPSATNSQVKSVLEGTLRLRLDPSLTIEDVCNAVSNFK